jgi:hypothetical protein
VSSQGRQRCDDLAVGGIDAPYQTRRDESLLCHFGFVTLPLGQLDRYHYRSRNGDHTKDD